MVSFFRGGITFLRFREQEFPAALARSFRIFEAQKEPLAGSFWHLFLDRVEVPSLFLGACDELLGGVFFVGHDYRCSVWASAVSSCNAASEISASV
jgi:hypothetical protein